MGGSVLDRIDDFQKFCAQDWTRTEKFHSPLISDGKFMPDAAFTKRMCNWCGLL